MEDTVRRAWWVVGLLLLLGACATVGPGAPRRWSDGRLVIPLPGDSSAALPSVLERARRAEVVYLGETHDEPRHHAIQAAVVEALVAAGARPAVALEMLSVRDQGRLDQALAGPRDAAEVGRQLDWERRGWPDFAMYWPILDTARRARLPVVAADLDPALTRRIAREGRAAAGVEAAGLGSLLPADPGREAAIARTIRDAHCGLLPAARLPAMVESWHARNVTLARSIARALDAAPGPADPRVVVVIGRGHQAPGGLPAQLAALRPGTRQLAVDLIDVSPGESVETAVREAAGDLVWLTPGRARRDPCASLRVRPRA
jgi:uncharacterized iron-regulated protein